MANEPEESYPSKPDEGAAETGGESQPQDLEGAAPVESEDSHPATGEEGSFAETDVPAQSGEDFQYPTDSDRTNSLLPSENEPIHDPEEEEGGPVKSFLEHLEDLRWVLIRCGVSLVAAMAACLAGAPLLVDFLSWPLMETGATVDLNPLGPMGSVVISMKIALYGGLTLSLPFILFFIGQFVMPALKAKEKVYFLRAFIVGAGLFMLGVMLCYFFILEISLKGMVAYTKWLGLQTTIWRAEEYFQFVIVFMVGMGISFELPVLVLSLVKLGVVQHEWLVKGRKYFFVINLVLCAFITPDFISTFFMVIPVQVLMEICILISAHWERQKKREAELALGSQSTDQISSAD